MTPPHPAWPPVALREEHHFGGLLMRCFADRPTHLVALLAQAAHARPDAEALVDGTQRWTWRKLADDSGSLAQRLTGAGVTRGDRVVLLCPNRATFVIGCHAVLRLGAVLVPVSTREAAPGIAYVLRQCGARAVLADAALADRIPPTIGGTGAPLVRMVLDAAQVPVGWDAWSPGQDGGTTGFTDAAPDEEDPAVILYTSGTTGAPKGAVLTHLNLVHSVLHYRHGLGLRPDDRSLLAVPASHVTGLVAIVLAMVGVGGCVVVLPEFKAAASLALAVREGVTCTLMVPAMYALWLREPALAHTDLRRLRVAGFGGAPMPQATIDGLRRASPGVRLFNAYGATETSSPTTMTPPGSERLEAVGVPLPCAQVRVVDLDGRDVPHGTPGEVWIAGPMVVPRYWDNPQATAAGFEAGWWKSGDIGTLDADGFLRVHDRQKDMINRGGYKVFSVEVENCLVGHPAVHEAATVGYACPVLGERIHAFVVVDVGVDTGMLARELADRCRAELADYKTPDRWTWLTGPLPRNPNGKILKRDLRLQAQAQA